MNSARGNAPPAGHVSAGAPGGSTTTTLAGLASYRRKELGTSDWVEVTQDRVDPFADATGDPQWIRVDRPFRRLTGRLVSTGNRPWSA